MFYSLAPCFSNPYNATNIHPTESKFLTVIVLCNTLFSIPVDEASQYLFVFIWEGNNSPRNNDGILLRVLLISQNPEG